MNKVIFFFLLLYFAVFLQADPDSLQATHFALDITVEAYDADFLQICDTQSNCFFQGLYNADRGFNQTLILPITTDSLFITLGDSLKSIAVDPGLEKILVDFTPPPPSWLQRLLWLKHDLESVFPFLALVIIFILKKNHDRKKEENEDISDPPEI